MCQVDVGVMRSTPALMLGGGRLCNNRFCISTSFCSSGRSDKQHPCCHKLDRRNRPPSMTVGVDRRRWPSELTLPQTLMLLKPNDSDPPFPFSRSARVPPTYYTCAISSFRCMSQCLARTIEPVPEALGGVAQTKSGDPPSNLERANQCAAPAKKGGDECSYILCATWGREKPVSCSRLHPPVRLQDLLHSSLMGCLRFEAWVVPWSPCEGSREHWRRRRGAETNSAVALPASPIPIILDFRPLPQLRKSPICWIFETCDIARQFWPLLR